MATLEIVFRGSDQSQPAVNSVRQGLGGVGEAADHAGQRTGGFFSGMLQTAGGFLAANVIGGITSQFGDLVGGMISGNAEFERYETQFGVLLGSADAAKARLAELAQFGASTPFELPELVQADKVLTSFGLHSQDMLTIVGDVAAGTGTSFQDMALLMGKFSAGATGEVLSRFAEMGVATKDELKKMGIEFDKAGSMTTPVAQAMPILEKLMKDKFGGMMDAQSKTFEGMVSNLADWKDQTLRAIGQPIFEVLKDKLGVLLEFLGSPSTKAALDAVAKALANGIGAAVDFLSTQAIPALTTAWTNLQPAIAALTPIVEAVIQMFTQSGDGAGILGGQLQVLGGVWAALQTLISAIVPPIQSIVLTVFGLVGDFLHRHGDDIRGFLQTTWTQIGEIVKLAVELVQAIVVPIFTAVAAFLKDHGAQISAALDAAWTMIKSIVNIALAVIQGVIKTVLAVIHGDWAGAWSAIKEMHVAVWEQIKVLVSAALTYLQNILKIAWDAIKGVASAAWNWVWHNIIEAAWEGIKSLISGAVDGVKSTLSGAWSNVKNDAQGAWDAVKGFITDPIGSAKSALDTTIGQIKGLLSGAWDDIKRGASSAWGGIADTIGSAFGGVVGNIKGVLNRIIDRVNDAIDAFNSLPGPDIGRIPHLARGTSFFEGGMALVGEEGPELVMLPRAAQVVPTNQTRALLAGAGGRWAGAAGAGGGDTLIFHIDARGSTMNKREYETVTRNVVDEASRRADVYRRTRRR